MFVPRQQHILSELYVVARQRLVSWFSFVVTNLGDSNKANPVSPGIHSLYGVIYPVHLQNADAN